VGAHRNATRAAWSAGLVVTLTCSVSFADEKALSAPGPSVQANDVSEWPDTVHLKGGERIQGRIVENSGEHVIVVLPTEEVRSIPWTSIEQVWTAAPAPAPVPAARARDPKPDSVAPPAPAPESTPWYGWQTLTVDAATAALITTSVVMDANKPNSPESNRVGYVGLGLYAVGPALVHALHGRPLASLASVGVRLAGPIAGAIAGFCVGVVIIIPAALVQSAWHGDKHWLLPAVGVATITGFGAGVLGPILLDAIELSRARRTSSATQLRQTGPTRSASAVIPGFSVSQTGASLGLSGQF
jgi:hypothetical protein